MFKKKACKKCGEGIIGKYMFCPSCGNSLSKKTKKEDLGILGENDFINEFENFQNNLFGGSGGRLIGKMFESVMRMLEREMAKEAKKNNHDIKSPKTNFQLFINGKRINDLESNDPVQEKIRKHRKEVSQINLPQNNLKKFSDLEKKEPKTDVRRFSDKVIYEINIPGVKSLKDISIIKLENTIEIKAISKDKAYNKLIPINFPIIDYNFSKGKLILELGLKN